VPAQAGHRLGTGAAELDGKVGIAGICRQPGGDLGDPSVIPTGKVVGDRRRRRGALRPQQLVLHVPAQRADEIERFGSGMGFHGQTVVLYILSVKRYYNYRTAADHHLTCHPRSDLGA
jgi:hypothetical protein